MEITAVDPPHRIDIAMTFWRGDRPTRAASAFVLMDAGDQTEVHWTFDEDRGLGLYLLGKLVFDRMMTRTFRDGLTTLKALVEAESGLRR
jgi:hypothetical protein